MKFHGEKNLHIFEVMSNRNLSMILHLMSKPHRGLGGIRPFMIHFSVAARDVPTEPEPSTRDGDVASAATADMVDAAD